ncbi:MAG: hypothetical protein HY665_00305 [Chloroflexi bacterium]|nr:hypothetical protein [Chloroflexota bacterium]
MTKTDDGGDKFFVKKMTKMAKNDKKGDKKMTIAGIGGWAENDKKITEKLPF